MKKIISTVLAAAIGFGSLVPVMAAGANSGAAGGTSGSAKTIAFPGAEGGGMYSKGARGVENYEVYHVTNLNDSGKGSFRDAVSKSGRFVVFDVSGMIDLTSNVTIKSNTTVLGQTAPGDGICFRGNNVKISGENIIVRYVRFRVGSHLADGSDTRTQDGLEITDNARNIILDHCSVSWGTDENLSAYAVENVTIQNCIIAEALNQSIHAKGEHSYGGIWGGVNLSVHHNLIATHKSRNPRIGSSETVAMTDGYTDSEALIDIRNNVIYNWGDKAGYGAENGTNVNIINNYYKPGPATPSNKRARIFELSPGVKYQSNWSGSIYADGNIIGEDSADAALVNENNWQIAKKMGIYLDASTQIYSKLEEPNETYINEYPITTMMAQKAYTYVLENAGARLPKLDIVDSRIIEDVKNGTAPDGANGSVGLVDEPTDGIPEGDEALYDDRGYPLWVSETRTADYDTDGDGIADEWEDKMGLNKENPTDSLFLTAGGRTYLELFAEDGINAVTGEISLEIDGTTATVMSDTARIVELYVDGEVYKRGIELVPDSVPAGATLISAKYNSQGRLTGVSTEVYTEGEIEFPHVSGYEIKHFVWNNMTGIQPARIEAKAQIDLGYDLEGVHTVMALSGDSYSNNAYQYVNAPVGQPGTVDGDFAVIMNLNQIMTVAKDSYGVVSLANGNSSCVIGAGSKDYKKVLYNNGETTALDDITMVKLERTGNTLGVYTGSSLLNWKLINEIDFTENETSIMFRELINDEQYATNIECNLITQKTTPQISITNITQNQRIGFNDDIEVEIVPDGAAVKQVSVSFNGEVVAEKEIDVTETETVSIPMSFTAIAAGTLEVSCVDENLGIATASVDVTISADLTPWKIADIGVADDAIKTYVSVTNDYTYKINAPSGYIGSVEDKCGYVYRYFHGDGRIYYRSRMQSSSQFGIMLRSSLESDADMFWFGGEYNAVGTEKLTYDLKHRVSGGEAVIDYTFDNQNPNLYFIAEKAGDTLNIYQTENSSTVYTTKKLLTSIDCSVLGDSYYIGFAAVGGGTNPPDAGWVAIDNCSGDDNYTWNFDNGLDWLWQMQEREVLEPKWYDEDVLQNRTGGKMALMTDEDYTSERYVFREYVMDDKLMPEMYAKVYVPSGSAGINVYFQTGDNDEAYKVTLTGDGKAICGDYEVDIFNDEWTFVSVRTDITTDGEIGYCSVGVGYGDALEEDLPINKVGAGEFREQINTAKKTPVTKAVYFEPAAGGERKSTYYVDDVIVSANEPSMKVTKLESWYTFEDMTIGTFSSAQTIAGTTEALGAELSGEDAVISSGEVKDDSKTIEGVKFTNKLRIKGTSKKFTVPVTKGAVVSVYASSASSSSTRPLYIDGVQYDLLSAVRSEYTYTGDADEIVIYAGDNIDVYGISVMQMIIE